MKKKSLLFSFISVIMVVSVILLLILVSKFKNRDEDNDPNDTPSLLEETSDNNDTNEKTKEYATYFAVNLPNTLNILVNTTINLKSGYININPISMRDKVTTEVTTENSEISGITIENNKITANLVGSYKVKYAVSSSATTEFSKTISVNVYQGMDDAHVNLITNSIIIGNTARLNELFTIQNTDLSYTIETDSKLTFSNNIFTTNSVGESIVIFTFTEGNVEYNYQFKINVQDIPEFEIVLNNVTDNTIEIETDKAFYINYTVINRNEGDISQIITAESSNTEVVTIESIKNPLIKIKAISTGEATITLTYPNDTSIKLKILVIVN